MRNPVIIQVQEAYVEDLPSKATIYNWIRESIFCRKSVFDSVGSRDHMKLEKILQKVEL